MSKEEADDERTVLKYLEHRADNSKARLPSSFEDLPIRRTFACSRKRPRNGLSIAKSKTGHSSRRAPARTLISAGHAAMLKDFDASPSSKSGSVTSAREDKSRRSWPSPRELYIRAVLTNDAEIPSHSSPLANIVFVPLAMSPIRRSGSRSYQDQTTARAVNREAPSIASSASIPRISGANSTPVRGIHVRFPLASLS